MKYLLLWALAWTAVVSGVKAQTITLDESEFCRSPEGPEITVTGTVEPASADLRVKNSDGEDITGLLAGQLRLAKNPLTGVFYAILDGPAGFSISPATYTIVAGEASSQVSIYYAGAQIVGPLSLSACDLATAIELAEFSPEGGTFEGDGVMDGMFDPVAAGPGEHEITYSGTFNDCEYSTTFVVTVSEPETGDFISGLAPAYCIGASASGTLSRTDGTLTNNGAAVEFDGETGDFQLSDLAAGDYELVYTVPGGCSDTLLFSVANANDVTFDISNPTSVCQGAANEVFFVEVYIDGEGPIQTTAGTFSDDAAVADVANGVYILNTEREPGTYTSTFSYFVGVCEYTTTIEYEVKEILTPEVTGFNSTHFTCETGAVALNVVPVIGPFSLTDPNGASVPAPAFITIGDTAFFFPSLLTPGAYTLAVSGTTEGECYGYSTTINIVESDEPTFGEMPTIYAGCDAAIPVEPTGGVLSYIYNGTETVLDGYVLNVSPGDQYVLKYNFGCGSVVQQIVDVLGASITGLNSAYYSSVTSVTMTGAPAGGTFSGPGVSGNVFSPSAAGVGTHLVTYTFITPDGCTLEAKRIVEVISIACNAPANLAASAITQTGATLSWNAVAPMPTLYQVRYKKVGSNLESFINLAGNVTSTALMGLEPGTTYQARVRARCVNGVFSPFSPLTFFTTETEASECVAPTSASATAMYTGTAQITWTAPDAPATQTFDVEITFPGGNGIIVTTTGTSATVTGLAQGAYTVMVYATCAPATIQTTSFVVPEAPVCQPVTGLTAVLSGTLNVAFAAPAGEAEVTAYEVSIDGTGLTQTSSATSASFNVSMLAGGATYTVRVRTICADGGSAEATTTFDKPAVDCSATPFINSIAISASSATVRWPRLANAQSYQVQYRLANSSEYMTVTVEQTASLIQTATLAGLSSSTGYAVRVRALCADGQTSGYSIERRFTTLAGGTREGMEIDFNEAVSALTVYPNPSKGVTTLSFVAAEEGTANVTVFNLVGARVYEKVYSAVQGENQLSLDLTGKASGIYFAKFTMGENAQTVRLVLE